MPTNKPLFSQRVLKHLVIAVVLGAWTAPGSAGEPDPNAVVEQVEPEQLAELRTVAESSGKKKKKRRRKKRRSSRKTIRHEVKKGETLSEIAEKYHVRVKDIVRWNKIEDPALIRIGAKLRVKVKREHLDDDDDDRRSKRRRKRRRPVDPEDLKEGELLDPGTPVKDIRKPTKGLTFTPKEGFAQPYSYDTLFRGFDGANCMHQGLDIGGDGEDWGVGTPVKAMVKGRVVRMGTPEISSKLYGRRDTRKGTEKRAGQRVPRRIKVEGYGTVYPFTRTVGRTKTGVILVTEVIGTEIEGHEVRYMHLAEIHPDIEVGDVVEAGQEIGLMGGTGFLESPPHVHIDIETPEGVRVDPAPFLGLEEVRPSVCKPINKQAYRKKNPYKGRSKSRSKYVYHTVKRGETLGRIARKYDVRVKDIVRWNKLKNADVIRRGKKLKIRR